MTTGEELVVCRLCGQQYRSIGHHVVKAHDMTPDEYRDRHGIRRGQPLTAPATRERFSAAIARTIEAGALAAHYAENANRAADAGAVGKRVKQQLRAAGVDLPHGTPPTPRAIVEAIVQEIEAGSKVASAVRRSSLSYSGFHSALLRYPDLKARLSQR